MRGLTIDVNIIIIYILKFKRVTTFLKVIYYKMCYTIFNFKNEEIVNVDIKKGGH